MATSTYTTLIGEQFCSQLSVTKEGLYHVCADMGLVPRTVWRWLNEYPDFWGMYIKARDFQTELFYDDINQIAQMPLTRDGTAVEDGGILLEGPAAMAEVARRKLIVDVMKFKLAKLQPKRFGDNRNIDLNVKVNQAVSREQFNVLLKAAEKSRQIEAPEVEYTEFTDEPVYDVAADFEGLLETEDSDDDDLG